MGKLLCACEVEGTCSLIIVGPNDWLCRVELEDAQKTAFMKWVTSLPHVGAILLADVAVFGARITFKKDDSGLLSAAAMAGADVRFKAASFARLAVPCPFRVLASMTPEAYRPTSFNWVHYLGWEPGLRSPFKPLQRRRSPSTEPKSHTRRSGCASRRTVYLPSSCTLHESSPRRKFLLSSIKL